jgi:hypothetical protein
MGKMICITFCFTLFLSCGLNSSKSKKCNDFESGKNKSESFYRPENLTVRSFIQLMTDNFIDNRKLNFVTFIGEFPQNWVKSEDITYLHSIMSSKKKCCGYMKVYSSYISTEYGEVGGFAILFLNSYINETTINLGLNCNPKSDKKSVEKIEDWYQTKYNNNRK